MNNLKMGANLKKSELKCKLSIIKKIKETFLNKPNRAIFIILLIAILYAIVTRFLNLGKLAYWGDDGMTYISTISVLEHGYPLLPSGNIMFHNIASAYLKSIPILLFGDNEFAHRFLSALSGVLIIPLAFMLIKKLTNKYIALATSIILAINSWQIEFAREARYYSEFQFFYILTVYFFYKGFFQDKKVYKILAVIFIFITTQIVTTGMTLIFLFIPLLIYKGFKKFFKRDIFISFIISSAIVLGEIIHRELFWKVGLSFYTPGTSTDIANPILRALSKYFSNYTPFFYKIFSTIYPQTYYIFIYGSLFVLIYILFKPLRNPHEYYINIYSSKKIDFKFPFNLFFLYFIFFSNGIFYGFGNMVNQQRYMFHVHPVFIAIFLYICFEISRILIHYTNIIISKIKARNFNKIKRYNKYYAFATLLIFIILTVSFTNYINPIQNFKITQRENGDPINSLFAPSNTYNSHYDPKIPGEYVNLQKDEGDIIIANDLLNHYPYVKQIDYWLWSGNLISWQPYDLKDGIYYDKFFGVPLIRDLSDFLKVLNENSDKNVWVITSDSIRKPAHTDSLIFNFLKENDQYKMITGKDNISSAYLFPALEDGSRNYLIYSNLEPTSEDIIKVNLDDGKYIFSFNEPCNSQYLNYGWSGMDEVGTWTNQKESLLFLSFKDNTDYNLDITIMPLYTPEIDQTVEIFFNGNDIEKLTLDSPGLKKYTITIRRELLKDGYNILKFKSKYLLSPRQLGISNQDSRNLAVYFNEISFYK